MPDQAPPPEAVPASTSTIAPGTVSPDGQLIWNGTEWKAVSRQLWVSTSWTRPLQLAIGGYLVLLAIYLVGITFLTQDTIRTVIRRTLENTPSVQAGSIDSAVSLQMNISLVVTIIFGVIYLALGAFTLTRRYSWVFYVDLVILAFGNLSLLGNLAGASQALKYGEPMWQLMVGDLVAAISIVLFVLALFARIRRGVWGCRREAVAE